MYSGSSDQDTTIGFRATAEYLRDVGSLVEHINAKTEDWALRLHGLLAKIQDALPGLSPELGAHFQEASAQLQRQDIVRQELESVGESLRSVGRELEELLSTPNREERLVDLEQVLNALRPRMDIDAEDVGEGEGGANVELF